MFLYELSDCGFESRCCKLNKHSFVVTFGILIINRDFFDIRLETLATIVLAKLTGINSMMTEIWLVMPVSQTIATVMELMIKSITVLVNQMLIK